jgi:hypothetical protein
MEGIIIAKVLMSSSAEVMDYKPEEYVNCRLKDDQNDICPYRRRGVFAAGRQWQVSRPISWWVFIK